MTSESTTIPNDQNATGRSFGSEELAELSDVLDSGILIAGRHGVKGRLYAAEFGEHYDGALALPCASGTTAVHGAIACLQLEPGDEVVVSPVTDMGAISPLFFEKLVPVFADVDPATGNVTASTIDRVISERVKAIIVTHLAGAPCEIETIAELAKEREIFLIEDCAQAFDARRGGTKVGLFGDVATFSTQQGKHISSGEGGMLLTRFDSVAAWLSSWIDKGIEGSGRSEVHTKLAMNSRLSELQAAVAIAQLRKLDGFVAKRIALAERMTAHLSEITGLTLPQVAPGDTHSFWKYIVQVDRDVHLGGRDVFAAKLGGWGALVSPRYVERPAFDHPVIATRTPPENADYAYRLDRVGYPGMKEFISSVIVLQWNERLTNEHIDSLAETIRQTAAESAVAK